MMPLTRSLAFGLIILLATCSAKALEWPATTLEARAEPFQKALTLNFQFQNDHSTPVHLLELTTSCSCLAARSDKKVYAPGEAGHITAEFSTTEPPGIYERHITVVTDESSPPQRLTVRIEIPELATLSPHSVEWKLKDDATEKHLSIRTNATLRISFTQAIPTNESFTVRLETVVPEQVYKLIVQPRRTDAIANAAIRINGHDRDGHEILINAYANVR